MRLESSKKVAADRFIAALRQPPAVLVAASDMKSEGHIGKAIRDRVVELDPLTQPLSETPTPRLIKAPRFGIEQESVMWGVDLNVSGS